MDAQSTHTEATTMNKSGRTGTAMKDCKSHKWVQEGYCFHCGKWNTKED